MLKVRKLIIPILALCIASTVYADQFRTVRAGKAILTKSPAFEVQTLAAGATTVDLSKGVVVITGINTGPTAISSFSNSYPGQVITIVGNPSTQSNATTVADSGSFKLSGNFTAQATHSLSILVVSSSNFIELSRSSN